MEESKHGHSHSHGGTECKGHHSNSDEQKKLSSEEEDDLIFAADKREYDNAITKLITVMCLSVIFITA